MPRVIGLTGGIGAGKSEALAAFARRGAAVLSSDEVVHRIYRRPDVVSAISERFGRSVLSGDGSVDRARLAGVAYAKDDGVAFLERTVHPLVGAARKEWVDGQRFSDPPPVLLVCEVPLLFEVGLEDHFDAVLVVTASDEVRRSRVEARGQDFDELARRQLPESKKVARADRYFVNDGDRASLERWVEERYREYRATAPRRAD